MVLWVTFNSSHLGDVNKFAFGNIEANWESGTLWSQVCQKKNNKAAF